MVTDLDLLDEEDGVVRLEEGDEDPVTCDVCIQAQFECDVRCETNLSSLSIYMCVVNCGIDKKTYVRSF